MFGWAAMAKMGPNDVRHVIWVLSMFFLPLFHVFFILTNDLYYIYI